MSELVIATVFEVESVARLDASDVSGVLVDLEGFYRLTAIAAPCYYRPGSAAFTADADGGYLPTGASREFYFQPGSSLAWSAPKTQGGASADIRWERLRAALNGEALDERRRQS